MSPPLVSISELVGSSKYNAISDDSLKDEDNAAWVMLLPPDVAAEWIELFSWIRLIDRLAESEWLEGWGSRFQVFKIGWRTLLVTGAVLPNDYHAAILDRMQKRWWHEQSRYMELASIHAWDEYVEATSEYHRSDMVFDKIEDYEWMLEHLGGSLFQIFPYQNEIQRQSVRAFGALDQFFNHLRDLEEDTRQHVCYFPSDVLDRFGVDRQEVIDHSCLNNEGFTKMMRFWLDDYLPYLFQKASTFLQQQDMHFSWRLLRHWFLRRHARIERALRVCNMDFRAATKMYFEEVKPNLGAWLKETFLAEGCGELLLTGPDLPMQKPGAARAEKPASSPGQEQLVAAEVAQPADSGLLVLSRQRNIRTA